MNHSNSTKARRIAQAAIAFEQRRTGDHTPKSVTVVLSGGTLVITLHEALSPAERALAEIPAGAAQMQAFHRQLFASSSQSLREEIEKITGMEVREATAEIEPASGAVVQADFQAKRSPDEHYRTTPLAGLWTHMKGGFYHDGRFATLSDVVNHYNAHFKLGLTEGEINDVAEYLKSL